jgi:hypothetical protein
VKEADEISSIDNKIPQNSRGKVDRRICRDKPSGEK